MIRTLMAVFGLLLVSCREQAMADAGVKVIRVSEKVRIGLCATDSDCEPGSLCACSLVTCSVPANFPPQREGLEGQCLSRLSRRVVHLPVRSDGGWILEGHPKGKWFATIDDALQDPWRFEPDYEIEAELGRVGRDAR